MISSAGFSKKARSRFRKVILTLLLTFIGLAYLSHSTFLTCDLNAQSNQVSANGNLVYRLDDEGNLEAQLFVQLLSSSDDPIPVTLFSTTIPFRNASQILVQSGSQYLKTNITKGDEETKVAVEVENQILRKGSPINLIIRFNVPGYSHPTSPIVSIPTIFHGIELTKLDIHVENEDNVQASPSPDKISHSDKQVSLSFSNPKFSKLTLTTADKIFYTYHEKHTLENLDEIKKSFDIMLPPQTSTQQVSINSISPSPSLTTIDPENNVQITYQLEPGASIEVEIIGSIVRIANQEQLPSTTNILNVSNATPTGHWEILPINYSQISKLLGDPTVVNWEQLSPTDRRSFILKVLEITSDRLESDATSQVVNYRLGANALVEGYTEARPQDYIDLTIGLLRMYSIPSRQIIGYTTGVIDQHSSDTTHTWVEYFDPILGWIEIDPYEADITGTIQLGEKYLDRIILMYRGISPTYPQYTNYTIKEMAFAQSESTVRPFSQLEATLTTLPIMFGSDQVDLVLQIENKGSSILRNFQLLNAKGELLHSQSTGLVPGEVQKYEISFTVSDFIRSLNEDGEIELSLTSKSIDGEDVRVGLTTSLQYEHPWWWHYFIQLISFVTFVTILSVGYTIFRKIYYRNR